MLCFVVDYMGWLCTGMDEAHALVWALCNSIVSPVSLPLLHAWMPINVVFCWWLYDASCARAWTRHAPWYVPCATAVCLVCPYFAACFSVSISWLGRAMHEACSLAHDQCMPRVAWPLLQASPVLDGVAQRRCTHANSAMLLNKIILFCWKWLATSTLVYKVWKENHNFSLINIFVCHDHASYLQLQIYIQACNDITTRSLSYYIVLYIAIR